MTLPTNTMPSGDGAGLSARQSIDIFVAIARLDERVGRLIDTLSADRKDRERDREEDRAEVASLKAEVTLLSDRVDALETSHKVSRQSLALLQKIGAGVVAVLSAIGGAVAWYYEKASP